MASLQALESSLNDDGIQIIYAFSEHTKDCPWVKDIQKDNNVIVFVPNSFFASIVFLIKTLEQYKPKGIYTHLIEKKQLLVAKIAKFFTGSKAKVAAHYHNSYLYNLGWIKNTLKKAMMHKDTLIGCSKDVADDFKNAGLKNPYYFVENAVNFERLDTFEAKQKDGRYHILMFGWDYERKGVDLAIMACDVLRKKYNHIALDICVSSDPGAVKDYICSLFGKVPGWVTLLPPIENVATYFVNSDLFISPSRAEGFCYAIIEAAYCKLISVSSKIPGQYKKDMPEIIWHETENTDDLANKIASAYLLCDKDRNKLTSILRKRAIAQYGIENWVTKVKEILSKNDII